MTKIKNLYISVFNENPLGLRERRPVFFARATDDQDYPNSEGRNDLDYNTKSDGKPLTDVDALVKSIPKRVADKIRQEVDSSAIQLSAADRDERLMEAFQKYLAENPKEGYNDGSYYNIKDKWHELEREYNSADEELTSFVRGEKKFAGEHELAKVDTLSREFKMLAEKFKGKIDQRTMERMTNKEMVDVINEHKTVLIERKQRLKSEMLDQMDTDMENRITYLEEVWDDPASDPQGVYRHKQQAALTQLDLMKEKIQAMRKLSRLSPMLRKSEFRDSKKKRAFAKMGITEANVDELSLRSQLDQELRALELNSRDLLEESKKGPSSEDAIMNALIQLEQNQKITVEKKIKDLIKRVPALQHKLDKAEDLVRDPKNRNRFGKGSETDKDIDNDIDANLVLIRGNKKSLNGLENEVPLAIRNDFEDLKRQIENARNETDPKEKARQLYTLQEAVKKLEDTLNSKPHEIESEIEAMESDVDNFVNQFAPRSKGGSQRTIVWLAFHDVWRMGQTVKEWSQRRYVRRSDNNIGAVGKQVFKNIKGLETLANEYDKKKEQAELDEVNKYKESYGNKDSWQIVDIMRVTVNKDEFKACLYLLSDLGRLRWDDPLLWARFNYFQNDIWFDVDHPSVELGDIIRLYDKMQKAVGALWDYDTFFQFKTTNDSNYDSGKQKFKEEADMTAEQPGGGIERALARMLREHKVAKANNQTSKVNPIKYEYFIEYTIDQGKMSPEGKLYYLIQGLATGLLSWERLDIFDSKKLNGYPVLELLASETRRGAKPTKRDIQEWALFDADSCVPSTEFETWYWTYCMHRQRVLQRTDKTFSQGNKLDHDDATAMLGYMHDTSIDTLLRRGAGDFYLPLTGYQNASVAFLNYLDNAALNKKYFGDENFQKQQISRIIQSFIRFDAITDSRMYKDRGMEYFRFSRGTLNEGPRSKGYYLHGSKKNTTEFYLQETRKYIAALDKDVLDPLLYGGKLNKETLNDYINMVRRKYDPQGTKIFKSGEEPPKTVDEVYLKAGEIIDAVVTTNQEGVNNMFEFIRKEQEEFCKQNDKDINSYKVTEQLDKVRQRMKESRFVDGIDVEPTDRLYDYTFSGDIEDPSILLKTPAGFSKTT